MFKKLALATSLLAASAAAEQIKPFSSPAPAPVSIKVASASKVYASDRLLSALIMTLSNMPELMTSRGWESAVQGDAGYIWDSRIPQL